MSDDEWWADLPLVEEEKSPEELWVLKYADPVQIVPYELPQKLCYYFLRIEPFFSNSDLNEPEDWNWRKYIVRSAAGWRCEDCNRDFKSDRKNLHTDHIHGRVPNDENDFQPHAFKNLRARCIGCHGNKHGYEIRDRQPINMNPFE